MRRIMRLIGGLWPRFAAGQLSMLVAAGAGLAFPWTVRNMFSGVLDSHDFDRLLMSIGMLAGVLLLRDAAEYVKRRLLGVLSERIVYRLREQVYDGLLSRSLGFFAGGSSGDISSTASNDINMVQAGITIVLTNLVQQCVVLGTVVTLMFLIDAPMAAIVCGFVPPLVLLSKVLARRSEKTAVRRQKILGEIMNIIQQSVAGIEVIRSYLLEGIASTIHRDKNFESLEASKQTVKIAAASSFWSGILGSLFLLTVMGVGGYRTMQGALSAPDLIAFILYSEMVTGPFVQLASLIPEIAKTRASYARILSVIVPPSSETAVPSLPKHAHTAALETDELTSGGPVEFRNVHFSYDGQHDVLKNTSFTVPSGQTTALVGPSGAGKSTVLRLIPRLYEPDRGNILISSRDIHSVTPATLRSTIGIVNQDPFIFDISAADNIRCGSPDATIEEVIHAAKLAHAHEFIDNLPSGYDTIVGEGGSRLSGGQSQRIAIARTFLKNPKLLLLDEATSALDGVSERAVLEALESLKRGRTTLIIAHRLETIRDADSIIVMDSGTVIDHGSHEELSSRCELFRELYRSAVSSQNSQPKVGNVTDTRRA